MKACDTYPIKTNPKAINQLGGGEEGHKHQYFRLILALEYRNLLASSLFIFSSGSIIFVSALSTLISNQGYIVSVSMGQG
uniref:Uncharacterized protein n=1 Tax=Salix viminalis TaxID=40686 RepID=A0A6N2LYR3_SALVM